MNDFERAFAATLHQEGGYSNDVNDSGGATKYGITERVARANGYTGAMRDLSVETAQHIARAQYWDIIRLDDVAALAPAVAREMFDTGYNMGVNLAARWLQRALSALNRQAADFPDVKPDGVIGPMTIAALRDFLRRRGAQGVTVLLRTLNAQQCCRYLELAEAREKDEAFVYGWISQRVVM